MSAVVTDTAQQSKRPRKKKANAENVSPTQNAATPADAEPSNGTTDVGTNGDGTYESPYIKELNKNIRNVKKKLNATQKVDSIMAENPNLSLDELLSSRKINPDQKAQAQKKPSLQASLAQFEEQLSQFKQFDEEYQKRIAAEKSALEVSHKGELDKVRDAAALEAQAESKKESKDNLLVLSRFLRAAAAKRQGGDETSPENRAFEGALLLVYGGEAGAVTAMEKLILGSEDLVPTVDQAPSEYTFKQVKDLSVDFAPYAAEEAWAEDVAQSEPTAPTTEAEEPSTIVSTDPTIAHATMTELEDVGDPSSNANALHVDTPTVPDASNIDAGAANAAAETNWDVKASASTQDGPDSWVEVPRNPAETETGNQATPAAMTGTQSWAEDVPTEMPPSYAAPPDPPAPAANGGDGFHEVHHGRGRGRGDSRGGGRGGRGRGGDRGGGEGGHRGGRGGFRGDRDRGGDGGHRGRGRGGRGNRGRSDGS